MVLNQYPLIRDSVSSHLISLYSAISWDAEERGVSEEGGEERGVSEEGGEGVFFVLSSLRTSPRRTHPIRSRILIKTRRPTITLSTPRRRCVFSRIICISTGFCDGVGVSFSKTSASSLSSSSFLFLSLTRDATRLISATILGTRTEDACGFGVISIAVSLAGSDIVERVSLLWKKFILNKNSVEKTLLK